MTQHEFTLLVQQHEARIYTVCYQLTRDHHLAQDLAQETFLSAYRHIDACDPAARSLWLTRIAVNKCKDHLKKAATRREAATEVLPEGEARAGPEEELLQQFAAADIQDQILSLKEPYRTPAILFFLQEQSIRGISLQLGRPEKTVYTQLSRARKQLQKRLKGGAP